KVVSNSLGSDTVANCLIKRLKTWRFPDPPPDKVGQVTYPFVFVSQ
ncbi:MAG: AgmX/PglI C-terminal domain-containing protein, partial [Bdellovibrionales bacterium]|nr:AgmX/PglI C-terminal domain-containing protein [Bdellovibrionales bacterium]